VILAIDPGTTESGWCQFDGKVQGSGVWPNSVLLAAVEGRPRVGTICLAFDSLAIEMFTSYGGRVGREVFETLVWIGRFQQAWYDPEAAKLIYRKDVVAHLLPPPKRQYKFRSTDANIRQAIIDKLGPIGTKAQPGPLYGVKSHAWAAVGVALTALSL
jgi:hypothetical protein